MLKKALMCAAVLAVSAVSLPAMADPGVVVNGLSEFSIAGYGGASRIHAEDPTGGDSMNGSDYGFQAQYAPRVGRRSHVLVQAGYDIDSMSKDGVDIDGNRLDIVVGYMGDVGKQSNWYVGPAYHSLRMKVSEAGTSQAATRTGYGVTGGTIIPFANNWAFNGELSGMVFDSTSSADGLRAADIQLGVEYRATANVGLKASVESAYYEDREDSDYHFGITTWRLGVVGHF